MIVKLSNGASARAGDSSLRQGGLPAGVQLAHYIYRALMVLGAYAALRGMADVPTSAKKAADKFLSSSEYSLASK